MADRKEDSFASEKSDREAKQEERAAGRMAAFRGSLLKVKRGQLKIRGTGGQSSRAREGSSWSVSMLEVG